jgi:LDH2 family malate/lactate/ureidoglycolate dehydrogenase
MPTADTPELVTVRIADSRLEQFCLECACRMGFADDDARALTALLMAGSLRTHPGQGQGVQRLAGYYERIKAGVIDPAASPVELGTRPAVVHLDANRAAGGVVGTRAMLRAIELAATYGIGTVGVRNSTHFGVAAYYSLLAAEAGYVGLTFTNAGPEIAPWGGTQPIVGTNPWSIAVPSALGWPVVFDMATASSGKGMIGWYERAGRAIPADWALTKDGAQTTDATEGMAGTLYPLGGAKGYALAALIDAITGVLTGASFGSHAFGTSHQDVGHLFIAIDVEAFMPLAEFTGRMTLLADDIRSSPLAAGATSVKVPGQLEYERQADRMAHGIPLLPERLDELNGLAEELGLDLRLSADAEQGAP